MKKSLIVLGLLCLPLNVWASCSTTGYTVIFINGVWDTQVQAETDKNLLKFHLGNSFNHEPITYLVGYNQSHLQGIGDLVETTFPALDQYDLDTMLMQLEPEVTTRKILIVGHSQGAEYANKMYDYFQTHGEVGAAVGVYAVATPDDRVAGGGAYRTYVNDLVINLLRGKPGFNPLPANITFVDPYPDVVSKLAGHSFTDAYLAAAPDTIVADIRTALGKLSTTGMYSGDSTGSCFDAPVPGMGYASEQALFGASDGLAAGLERVGQAGYTGVKLAAGALGGALAAVGSAVGNVAADIGTTIGGAQALSQASEPKYNATNFDIVSRLYGSSLTKQEYQELLNNQGGAVALSVGDEAPAGPPEVVPSVPNAPAPTAVPAPDPGPAVPIGPAPGFSPGGGVAYTPPEPVSNQMASDVDDTASSTDSDTATSTPDSTDTSGSSATTTVVTIAGSPVIDSLDVFDSWVHPPGLDGSWVFDDGSDGQCHAGGCIYTGTGAGTPKADEKTGTPQADGHFTFWARYKKVIFFPGPMVVWCAGGIDQGKCDYWQFFAPNDDSWHQYYVAWRDNTAQNTKEYCTLADTTDSSQCTWQASGAFALGDQIDTLALMTSSGGRYDLGEAAWFDELGE